MTLVCASFWGGIKVSGVVGMGKKIGVCLLLLCVPFGVFSPSAPVYGVCCSAFFAGVVHFDYSAGFAFFFVS
jgi:hypothetical protein